MDGQDVARQTQIEHEMLGHLIGGLRATAGWQVPGPEAPRKLSTLRFLSQSFQRHLERLLALEEGDGYMGLALTASPQLARATASLRAEHERFRAEAGRVARRLESLPAEEALGTACGELLDLLAQVEAHSRKEMALVQEAFGQDEGGEG